MYQYIDNGLYRCYIFRNSYYFSKKKYYRIIVFIATTLINFNRNSIVLGENLTSFFFLKWVRKDATNIQILNLEIFA